MSQQGAGFQVFSCVAGRVFEDISHGPNHSHGDPLSAATARAKRVLFIRDKDSCNQIFRETERRMFQKSSDALYGHGGKEDRDV